MKIRKLEKNDLQIRIDLLNSPLVSRDLNVNETFNLSQTLLWFEKNQTNKTRFDCVFTINDEIVGMGGLSNISSLDSNASLYIYLSPQYWGCGNGTTALKLLCEYGFKNLKLNKIYLYTFANNIRANKLYEKIGFKLEGILREHTMHNGKLNDRYMFGLLKNEFK